MLNEKKLEYFFREFIHIMSLYMKQGFTQLGKLIDLFSFYIHREEDDEPTFEVGPYSVIGFFLILLGGGIILASPIAFPPLGIIVSFMCLIIIGLVLLLK